MAIFISNLPISDKRKDELRKHERAVTATYGGMIFLVASAGKALEIDRYIVAGLMILLTAGLAIRIVDGRSRDVVTQIFIAIFVLFAVLQFLLGTHTSTLVTFCATVATMLYAAWRGRRDWVRSGPDAKSS